MRRSPWLGLFVSFVGALVACGEQPRAVPAPLEACPAATRAAPLRTGEPLLFQGFHWRSASYGGRWYDTLASHAADLADLGVTHVWFPPPSDSTAAEGYLPRRLNVLDSRYGSESQLKSAIATFREHGIASIADVVINHRTGTRNWADFTDPVWDCKAVVANDEWPGHCGGPDSGDGYAAGRDLDHDAAFVRDGITTWMKTRLGGAGFTGIRYDYSRGYAAKYARSYAESFGAEFCAGEVWPDLDYANVDAHRQQLVDWVDATGGVCATFDFTTKGLLNRALAQEDYGVLRDAAGRPGGAIGWRPERQVTFVDNHDTGPAEDCKSGQNQWPVPCTKVLAGYAYVLTHPGIPSLFYAHVYDWSLHDPIRALVAARAEAGVAASSAVVIARAEKDLYAAYVTGGSGRLAVKLGNAEWTPGSEWDLVTQGDGYRVWRRAPADAGPASFEDAEVSTDGPRSSVKTPVGQVPDSNVSCGP